MNVLGISGRHRDGGAALAVDAAPAGSQNAPIDATASAAHVLRTRASRLSGISGIGTLAISFPPSIPAQRALSRCEGSSTRVDRNLKSCHRISGQHKSIGQKKEQKSG